MRFSFCRRLQNHTRTTSFSSCKESASEVISCAEGFVAAAAAAVAAGLDY